MQFIYLTSAAKSLQVVSKLMLLLTNLGYNGWKIMSINHNNPSGKLMKDSLSLLILMNNLEWYKKTVEN